ncbi:hypothetical protein ACHAPX_005148 [Trichoderma viride]
MLAMEQDCTPDYEDGIDTIRLDMYDAGGEEGSGFHVFNVASDQYHRAEVLQQTGAIDVTCRLEKVIHGAMSADSDRYATLVVLQWLFQPNGRRRISEASIELLFEAQDSGGGDDVEVERISFDGTYSLMPTTQHETITKRGEASVAINQLASSSLSGKWEKLINRQTWDAITLTGGKRVVNNKPPNRIAKWVLSENKSQPKGIPATLKVGVIVSRSEEKRFTCRVAFACKTDMKTTAESFFKKIPRDDPIVFQPDIHDKGARPNKSISYGDDGLRSVNLDEVGDVTFRTVNMDALSEKTTTDQIFGEPAEPQTDLDQRKLGLSIVRNFGWSGSNYDDSEYAKPNPISKDQIAYCKTIVLSPFMAYATITGLPGLMEKACGGSRPNYSKICQPDKSIIHMRFMEIPSCMN